MLIYTIIITLTILIIISLNYILNIGIAFLNLLLLIFIFIAIVLIINALVAFITIKLPNKYFNHNFKIFKIYKFEKHFYEFLRIRKWKDKIPELGSLANFRKNKVERKDDNLYIEKFLEQCCYGEVNHFISMIFSLLIILIKPSSYLFITLPISIASIIINYLSYIILRYTRPKLYKLYLRNIKKGSKHE